MKKPGEILGQAPSKIKEMIKNQIYRLDDIGMENSFVFIFDELNLVLKVTHNKDDYLKEIQMMKWLKDKVEVPNIIEYDNNKNYYYLLMTKLDGFMACDEELMKNPEKLIDSLVSGIKSFWKIPIVDCPIDNRIENKLKLAKQRIEDNTVDIDDWDQELTKKRFETPNDLYQYLLANQIEEELVMSHGDY